jgi:hypothetical protein
MNPATEIPQCVHRLLIAAHLWCEHPNVHIGWANNFLDLDPTGKPRAEPEFCKSCPLVNGQAAKVRTPPTEFTPPAAMSGEPYAAVALLASSQRAVAPCQWAKKQGPKEWADLHRAACNPQLDFAAYVETLIKRIGCEECAREARAFVAAAPPPIEASRRFAWSVTWHNSVNRRLGKPELSIDEACRAAGGEVS